jgi:hypothetical protein
MHGLLREETIRVFPNRKTPHGENTTVLDFAGSSLRSLGHERSFVQEVNVQVQGKYKDNCPQDKQQHVAALMFAGCRFHICGISVRSDILIDPRYSNDTISIICEATTGIFVGICNPFTNTGW